MYKINKRIRVLKSELEEDVKVRENLIRDIKEMTNTLESLNLRIANSKAVLRELESLVEDEEDGEDNKNT